MSTTSTSETENFPTTRAGLLAGAGIVALILFTSAAQAAGTWFLGTSLTFVLFVVLLLMLPRLFKPRGSRLRAPVAQRQSGWIYMGTIAFGAIFVTTTLITGQPLWALVAGIAVTVATLAALIALATRHGGAVALDNQRQSE